MDLLFDPMDVEDGNVSHQAHVADADDVHLGHDADHAHHVHDGLYTGHAQNSHDAADAQDGPIPAAPNSAVETEPLHVTLSDDDIKLNKRIRRELDVMLRECDKGDANALKARAKVVAALAWYWNVKSLA